MLELMLDNHSQVAVCPEISSGRVLWRLKAEKMLADPYQALIMLDYFYRYTRHLDHPIAGCFALQALRKMDYPVRTETWFQDIIRDYLARAGADCYIEKTPENLFYIPTINEIFPQSKYIALLRDPIDIMASLCKGMMAGKKIPMTRRLLITMAVLVKRGLQELYRHKTFSSHEHIRIKYEDLVYNPRKTLEEVCQFMNIDFEAGMLEFQHKRSYLDQQEQMYILHHNLHKPVTSSRVGQGHTFFMPEQLAFLHRFWLDEIAASPYSTPVQYSRLNILNQLILYWTKFKFFLKTYMIEEYKNKLRFRLHHYAMKNFGNSCLKSFIFKNIVYREEEWEQIKRKYLKL